MTKHSAINKYNRQKIMTTTAFKAPAWEHVHKEVKIFN